MSFNAFRGSTRPSLGVELEPQPADALSLARTGAIDKVVAEIPPGFQNSVKPEFHDCRSEINTGVGRDITEVEHDSGPKLVATAQGDRRHGVPLGWGGPHPFSHWRDQPVVPTPRYLRKRMTIGAGGAFSWKRRSLLS
jgi:carboxylate-amine ligase